MRALPILLTLLTVFVTRQASAQCSCPANDARARNARRIFEGSVTAISEDRVTFDVVQAWRGDVHEHESLSIGGTECRPALTIGSSHIVYDRGEALLVCDLGEPPDTSLGVGVVPVDIEDQPAPTRAPPMTRARGGCAGCSIPSIGERRAGDRLAPSLLAVALFLAARRRSRHRIERASASALSSSGSPSRL